MKACLKFITAIVLCVYFSFLYHPCQGQNSHGEYKAKLDAVLKDLKKGNRLTPKQIENVIPTSIDDSKIFYALDYNDNTSTEFNQLGQLIKKLAIEGNQNIIARFIAVSQFVDGYFADDYFQDAKKIFEMQPDLFCKSFDRTSVEKKQRLIDYGLNCLSCKKCDLSLILDTKSKSYSDDEIKMFFCVIGDICSDNVEFSEVSNEALFHIFLVDPAKAIKVLGVEPNLPVKFIVLTLSNPVVTEKAELEKIYDQVSKLEDHGELRKKIMDSLQLAIGKS